MSTWPIWPDNATGATWIDDEDVNLPTRRTERFYANDSKVQWERQLWERGPDERP